MANSKNGTLRARRMACSQKITLTSPKRLLRAGAPTAAEIQNALDVLYRIAAAMEVSEEYANCVTNKYLNTADRLDLLRAASVLVFKNAGADTVWKSADYILVPVLRGLCEGQRETSNIIGTGMCGSDGRDHLRELDRDEGEPFIRILHAIARHCPQVLYGHRESTND